MVLASKHLFYLLLFLLPVAALKAQSGNIEFTENKGQWDKQVKFQGDVAAGAFFIRSNGGFTVLQRNPDDFEKLVSMMHGHGADGTTTASRSAVTRKLVIHSHVYHVNFIGANTDIQMIPDKPVSSYSNYLIGNDPSKWGAHCKIYQGVTAKNVYPNIDVRYYTEKGLLKYDIIANPGADVSKIALQYEGVDKLELQKKELVIKTSVGNVKELSPYTYQFDGKERKDLESKFTIKNNIVKFNIRGYDRNSTLIIDPSVVFISFSKSTANNWGYTATYGPDGSMYGGGIVFAPGFPTQTGAYQEQYAGGGSGMPFDIGLIKLSPDGHDRIYATYLGGANGDEQPHSLVVDNSGNLIMAGRSNSSDYPVTDGALSSSGYDIVVTKLNGDGSALLGSRKIGGSGDDGVNISVDRNVGPKSLMINYGDDGRSEVILDAANNVYLASCTQSANFPLTGGFQNALRGGQDGVLLKFAPNLGTILFSTYLGGNGDDAAYVLSLAPNGDIYTGGATTSTGGFPGMGTPGTISPAAVGGLDGFVSIVSNNGATIQRSTFLGTSADDAIYGLKFDRLGFPYVMGQTYGAWTVRNATYVNAGAKQFISKLKPDLSDYVYSTTFGKASTVPSISPVAFLVDRCENVYVSGWGGKADGYQSSGTSGLPVTPDAYQSNSIDNQDFYFFVLQKNASAQLYGSFLGENGKGFPDHVDGGTSRFDQNGVIYQAICGNCVPVDGKKPLFKTTPNVWGPTNASQGCNLVMVKIAFNLAGIGAGVQASINGEPRDTAGCIPLIVDFKDTVAKAKSYEWTFGDGSPMVTTTVPDISHTYTAIGTYTVMLVAIDSNTCNIRDTVFTHIRAGDKRAFVGLSFSKLNPCDSFKYQFNNLSLAPPGVPFNSSAFVWNFGDGTGPDTTSAPTVFHNYVAAGSYHVQLTLIDTSYCNAPQLIDTIVSVAVLVKAAFVTPPTGCAPYAALFDNTSLAGQTFQWDFGDGSPLSTEFAPTHIYQSPGEYTIRLIASNEFTCNKIDSTRFTIKVYDKPTANFTYTPVPPTPNTPNIFTNSSSDDAVSFVWIFGDGDTLATTSKEPVVHQYNATGTFNACLVAINIAGCTDTACQSVETIVNPLVDVPNAFTPNGSGINTRVGPRGFGIAKMRFIIWNRWGQIVFDTNSLKSGWDGRYKGVVQPMDVYAYTLDVQFFDGTKTTKKGDITLIK